VFVYYLGYQKVVAVWNIGTVHVYAIDSGSVVDVGESLDVHGYCDSVYAVPLITLCMWCSVVEYDRQLRYRTLAKLVHLQYLDVEMWWTGPVKHYLRLPEVDRHV